MPLALALLVVFSGDVVEWLSMLDHGVDYACDLVSCGYNGFLRTALGAHAAEVGAERGVGSSHRLRRQAKGLTGAISRFERAAAQDLAARDVIVWCKA